MQRTIAVFRIEAHLNLNSIADFRAGRLANVTVQVQVEAAVADRHHVDAP